MLTCLAGVRTQFSSCSKKSSVKYRRQRIRPQQVLSAMLMPPDTSSLALLWFKNHEKNLSTSTLVLFSGLHPYSVHYFTDDDDKKPLFLFVHTMIWSYVWFVYIRSLCTSLKDVCLPLPSDHTHAQGTTRMFVCTLGKKVPGSVKAAPHTLPYPHGSAMLLL